MKVNDVAKNLNIISWKILEDVNNYEKPAMVCFKPQPSKYVHKLIIPCDLKHYPSICRYIRYVLFPAFILRAGLIFIFGIHVEVSYTVYKPYYRFLYPHLFFHCISHVLVSIWKNANCRFPLNCINIPTPMLHLFFDPFYRSVYPSRLLVCSTFYPS